LGSCALRPVGSLAGPGAARLPMDWRLAVVTTAVARQLIAARGHNVVLILVGPAGDHGDRSSGAEIEVEGHVAGVVEDVERLLTLAGDRVVVDGYARGVQLIPVLVSCFDIGEERTAIGADLDPEDAVPADRGAAGRGRTWSAAAWVGTVCIIAMLGCGGREYVIKFAPLIGALAGVIDDLQLDEIELDAAAALMVEEVDGGRVPAGYLVVKYGDTPGVQFIP